MVRTAWKRNLKEFQLLTKLDRPEYFGYRQLQLHKELTQNAETINETDNTQEGQAAETVDPYVQEYVAREERRKKRFSGGKAGQEISEFQGTEKDSVPRN